MHKVKKINKISLVNLSDLVTLWQEDNSHEDTKTQSVS